MDTNTFARLQKNLTPDVLGVWWVTDSELTLEQPYLHELDYFFDGLLMQKLRIRHSSREDSTLLVGHSFDSPFYLVHSQQQRALSFLEHVAPTLKIHDNKRRFLPLGVNESLISKSNIILKKYAMELGPSLT
jgi:hypothetical protein